MLDYINLQLFNQVINQNLNCNMQYFIVFYSLVKQMVRVERQLFSNLSKTSNCLST